MTIASELPLAASAFVVGVLIGCVGIGGVLLPPALIYLGGFDLSAAMATSVWSFLFTGITGTATYARRGDMDWRALLWLVAGIVPAALLGALAGAVIPSGVLKAALAVLVIAAGADAILRQSRGERQPGSLKNSRLLALGVLVGFGSAITGTGGPVILVPLLVAMRISTLEAVGLSQPVQIPVAVFATVGFALRGEVQVVQGTVLGIFGMVGVLVGARIAHVLPLQALRNLAAAACIGTGLLMLLPGP